jgi:hypothetical protein
MKSPVQLYLRVRLPNGTYPYLRAAYSSNGHIRPHHAMHKGRATHFRGSTYYLRHQSNGKRVWESAGNDSSLALLPVSPPTPLSGLPAFLVNSVPIPQTEPGQWVLVEVPIRRGCMSHRVAKSSPDF